MVVVALLSVYQVESVYVVSVYLVVNCTFALLQGNVSTYVKFCIKNTRLKVSNQFICANYVTFL